MPVRARPQKWMCDEKEPIDIWTNFFADNMIPTVLNNTKKKDSASNNWLKKYVVMINTDTLKKLKKKSFLLFLVFDMQGGCLDKIFLEIEATF